MDSILLSEMVSVTCHATILHYTVLCVVTLVKRPKTRGWGTPLVYAALKGMVLPCFGLKTGIDFAHFGLVSGIVFEGTKGVYKCIYRFNSKRVRKKEKYANSKLVLRNLFGWRSNRSNDDIIS